MKSTIVSLLFALVFLMFFSCENDSFEDPYQGRIKKVKYYNSVQDTIVRNVEEYKYDARNRLIAIENKGGSVKLIYNTNNQLIGKCSYYNDNGVSVLNDSTRYIYGDLKLVAEEEYSVLVNNLFQYKMKVVYEYENDKLVKRKRYRDSIFEQLIVYEYKDDLLKKESIYTDSLGIYLDYTKSHYYDEHKKLSFTTSMNHNYQGYAWLQTIYYFYNEHGDLDLEYAEQTNEISAAITYCRRYEYY